MRFLLAIICPPLAVLLCGKPAQAVLNCLLCFALILPGIIHALLVVQNHKADKRHKELVNSIHSGYPRKIN